MASESDERDELRKYLLGEVSHEERLERIEKRLLTDDEFFEELEIAKDALMDEYLNGGLRERERERFEAHFKSSTYRRRELRFASAFRQRLSTESARPTVEPARGVRRTGFGWMPLLRNPYVTAFASAFILIALGLSVWRAFIYQSDVDKGMVALRASFGRQRYVEARISALEYAPLIQLRGGEGAPDDIQRNRAERFLLDAVGKSSDPSSLHALGRLRLAERKFGEAVAQIQQALKMDGGNAQLHSDLGAALLEEGKERLAAGDNSKSFEEFARSLEHLEAALAILPRLPEALFNRALVLQYMTLPGQAREAWRKYLEVDSDSAWATEARRKLGQLEERSEGPRESSQLLDSFLGAYRAGEDEKAWQIISQNREMITGKLIPWQLSAAYLNYSLNGQAAAAAEALGALSYAGDLEARRGHDPYFSQLHKFYSSLPKGRRADITQAHSLMNEGFGLCQQAKFSEALELFLEARRLFSEARDIYEAGLTEYWVAYCYFQSGKAAESITMLSDLAGRSESHGHRWLLAQALSQTANVRAAMNEHSRSLELNERALGIFEELSDSYGLQKSLSQLGNTYRYLSGLRQSLGYVQRCLSVAHEFAYSPRQMWRNYDVAAQTFYALGLNAAAAAYGREALRLGVDEMHDPAAVYITYLHLGLIYAKLREYGEARRLAGEGLKISRSLAEGKAKKGMIANSTLQMAHIRRYGGDFADALRDYDEAIQMYDGVATEYQQYEAHKGRLLCHVALGDDDAVRVELPEVLGLFEKYRSVILEEQNKNSFFDAEQGTYDVAIGYEYARAHDPQQAFEYSEDSRARSLLDLIRSKASASEPDVAFPSGSEPLPLSAIRERMPEESQIVQYAMLGDRLLIWVISRERFEVIERKIRLDDLDDKVRGFLSLVEGGASFEGDEARRDAMELYDILIGPIEPLLDPRKELCVVPDKVLNHLPFAALVSPRTGRYLIADYALLFSPSANVFVLNSGKAAQLSGNEDERLLVIGDPSFDRATYPRLPRLPSATLEAERIAELYTGAVSLIGRDATKARALGELAHADIAHFACHYVIDEHSPALSKLVLSPQPDIGGGGELLTSEVPRADLGRTRLIVLSACHTAVEGYYKGEGMIGMSRAFLASGVPLVVASQWDVDSDATAALMISFHRHRKLDKVSTAEALRRAQVEMLSSPDARFRHPSNWAAFLPIGAHTNF